MPLPIGNIYIYVFHVWLQNQDDEDIFIKGRWEHRLKPLAILKKLNRRERDLVRRLCQIIAKRPRKKGTR